MKDIKFRGKQIDSGEWAYGLPSYDTFGKITEIEIWEDCGETMEFYLIDPDTVGQFTGLRDRNGTEIYEGDICKDSMSWVFEVLWDSENARFIGYQSKPRGDVYICHVGGEPAVEIVGNIHDNPGLLKGNRAWRD